MTNLKASYRRLGQWSRNRSRGGYALLMAIVAYLVVFALNIGWSGDYSLLEPAAIALGIGFAYYVVDPR